jgi:hypothetical protein
LLSDSDCTARSGDRGLWMGMFSERNHIRPWTQWSFSRLLDIQVIHVGQNRLALFCSMKWSGGWSTLHPC